MYIYGIYVYLCIYIVLPAVIIMCYLPILWGDASDKSIFDNRLSVSFSHTHAKILLEFKIMKNLLFIYYTISGNLKM